MNLEKIKRMDDTFWLEHLKNNTVFDVNEIKEQKKWLINQAETLQKIAESWVDTENNGTDTDAIDFYTVAQDILSDNEQSKYPLNPKW